MWSERSMQEAHGICNPICIVHQHVTSPKLGADVCCAVLSAAITFNEKVQPQTSSIKFHCSKQVLTRAALDSPLPFLDCHAGFRGAAAVFAACVLWVLDCSSLLRFGLALQIWTAWLPACPCSLLVRTSGDEASAGSHPIASAIG